MATDVDPIARVGDTIVTSGGIGSGSYSEDVLDGSASTDPDGFIVSYAWDVNGDGQYDDATGAMPVIGGQMLDSLRLKPGGTYTVGLKVTDNEGAVGTATAALHINRAPVFHPLDAGVLDDDGRVTFDPRNLFTDPDGDPLTITPAFAPFKDSNGTLTLNPDGSYTYPADFGTASDPRPADEGATFLFYASDGSSFQQGEIGYGLSYPFHPVLAQTEKAKTTAHRSVTIDPLADALYPNAPSSYANVFIASAAVATANAGQVSIADGKLVFNPGLDFSTLAPGQTRTVEIDYTVASSDAGNLQTRSTAAKTFVTVTGSASTGTVAPVAVVANAVITRPDVSYVGADQLALDGSGSADPDGRIVSYAWDLNGDGEFDDAFGARPIIGDDKIAALGYQPGGTYTAALKVTDNNGATDTATGTIHINRPPAFTAPPGFDFDLGDNESETINLKDFYADPDGDPITITPLFTPFQHRYDRLTLNPDGSYTYDARFNSAADIAPNDYPAFQPRYVVSDGTTSFLDGFDIEYTNVFDPVLATDVKLKDTVGQTLTFDPLTVADFQDPRESYTSITLSAAATEAPHAGQVSIVDNRLVFDPGSDFDDLAAGQTRTVKVDYTLESVLDLPPSFDGDTGEHYDQSSAAVATITVTGTGTAPPQPSGVTLTGSPYADTLAGGRGNDTIGGGAGADVLTGGPGDEVIRGGDKSDVLHGNAGDDVLIGGAGHDRLVGGAGADRFVFGSPVEGGKTIVDFTHGQDKLVLSGKDFGVADGAALNLFTGPTPAAQNQQPSLLLDDHGLLRFDADGTGPGKPVFLVQFERHAVFDKSDIVVA